MVIMMNYGRPEMNIAISHFHAYDSITNNFLYRPPSLLSSNSISEILSLPHVKEFAQEWGSKNGPWKVGYPAGPRLPGE